jgi:hypothetical protein
MEIQVGNIRYIYTFQAAPPEPPGASGIFSPSVEELGQRNSLMSAVAGMLANAKTKEEKEKLEEMRRLLAAVLGKLHSVPGAAMKAKIMALASDIITQAQSGDIAGAALAAADLKGLADRCIAAGERIGASLGQMNSMAVSLPGAGKSMMVQLMTAAKDMINAATDPADLEAIAGLLERAVDIGNRMMGTKVGSPEYMNCLEALGEVAKDLNAMREAGPQAGEAHGPAMGQDALTLSFRSAAETMAELKGKTTDVGKQKQIGTLEQQLAQIELKAAKLPEAMRAQLQSALNHIVTDTANGKLPEAQAATNALLNQVDQASKLNTVLETKLALGAKVAARLQGPAKAGLEALLEKAEAARQLAKTPEDLQAIDAIVFEAIQHAQRPTKAPGTQQLQARKLKALERQLGEGPAKPTFDDRLTLNQTKPAAEKAEGLPSPEGATTSTLPHAKAGKAGKAGDKPGTARLKQGGTAPLRADEALQKNPTAAKRDVWAGGNTGALHPFVDAATAEPDFNRLMATVTVPAAGGQPAAGPQAAPKPGARTP